MIGFTITRRHSLSLLRCVACAAVVSPHFSHRCPVKEKPEQARLRCWESIFRHGRASARCPCCRATRIRFKSSSGSTFQAMHIVPRVAGGPMASWNLLPGCGCNQNTGRMHLLDWMGTRGNKRHLLKRVMLRKYKALVPPVERSLRRGDAHQLLEWIEQCYRPPMLSQYAQWLLLSEKDLRRTTSDD